MDNQEFQNFVIEQLNMFAKQFSKVDEQFNGLRTELSLLRSQVNENTQILKALEHSSEVNRSEHDRMASDIRGLIIIKNEIANVFIKDKQQAFGG